MIFNRLTGLDIGPPPNYLIPDNIKPADAPVRYPFLWNAPIQDQTQWPGFADNGNDILALARNLGEVFGVFAVFAPKIEGPFVNFLDNSANFDGLSRLEDLIKQIGPPKWLRALDINLAAQGGDSIGRPRGGCNECHGIRSGKMRPSGGDLGYAGSGRRNRHARVRSVRLDRRHRRAARRLHSAPHRR
jgi:hypothetical protein